MSCSECLCVQALMPQQWSTVFIFFPAHWMPGMFADHMIPCVLRMFTSLIYVYEFNFMLTILLFVHFVFYFAFSSRTVMKSGPEIVKAGLRSFFESAADDIEKMVENLKLGKVSTKNQVRCKYSPVLRDVPLLYVKVVKLPLSVPNR